MGPEPIVIEGTKTKGLRKDERGVARYLEKEDLEMRIKSHKHEVDEYQKKHNVD